MKKKDSAGLGMTIPKKMRIAGITFYLRNGQVVGRASSTHEKRSNTLPQFIQRQKMRHTTALWKMLRYCDVMFTERRTAYLADEEEDLYWSQGAVEMIEKIGAQNWLIMQM